MSVMLTSDGAGRDSARRVRAVGALARDDQGRILLVLRANEPDRGTWSLPGGRVELGEQPEAAIVREVLEETSLVVRIEGFLGTVERPHPDGGCYVIDDYAVAVVGGQLRAATDAQDARWVASADLPNVSLTPGLLAALREWGVTEPTSPS